MGKYKNKIITSVGILLILIGIFNFWLSFKEASQTYASNTHPLSCSKLSVGFGCSGELRRVQGGDCSYLTSFYSLAANPEKAIYYMPLSKCDVPGKVFMPVADVLTARIFFIIVLAVGILLSAISVFRYNSKKLA